MTGLAPEPPLVLDGPPGAPPGGEATPGAQPQGPPFQSTLEAEWARTAAAEGQRQSDSAEGARTPGASVASTTLTQSRADGGQSPDAAAREESARATATLPHGSHHHGLQPRAAARLAAGGGPASPSTSATAGAAAGAAAQARGDGKEPGEEPASAASGETSAVGTGTGALGDGRGSGSDAAPGGGASAAHDPALATTGGGEGARAAGDTTAGRPQTEDGIAPASDLGGTADGRFATALSPGSASGNEVAAGAVTTRGDRAGAPALRPPGGADDAAQTHSATDGANTIPQTRNVPAGADTTATATLAGGGTAGSAAASADTGASAAASTRAGTSAKPPGSAGAHTAAQAAIAVVNGDGQSAGADGPSAPVNTQASNNAGQPQNAARHGGTGARPIGSAPGGSALRAATGAAGSSGVDLAAVGDTSAQTSATSGAAGAATSAGESPALAGGGGVDLQQAIDDLHGTIQLAARQGVTQARIALQPRELGEIRINLTQTAGGLLVRVTAGSAAAAQALAAGHAELRQSLSSLGVELTNLSIGHHDQAPAHGEGAAAEHRREGAATAGHDARRGARAVDDQGDPLPENQQAAPETSTPAPTVRGGALVDVLA
ncbi:MAG TPA: flagellar hook-length control protein FliK [Solirubrobacteraceae bacterium]|jgi:flagellar hook-length control protein FliK|nr:flagellar hook-length control protein FliK [Solirubrobacteraceae bacterium]